MSGRIVLASSSRYRQQLLARLQLDFDIEVPQVDEAPLGDEDPRDTSLRLSLLKARAAARQRPSALVIGADQVAELDGRAIGKPGSHSAAHAQLLAMSGRTVRFHSGIAVLDAPSGRHQCVCVDTDVCFRALSPGAIESYLRREPAYDCAGSAKIESLGICLVSAVHSEDPTAIIGLPLIALTTMLSGFGVELPPR